PERARQRVLPPATRSRPGPTGQRRRSPSPLGFIRHTAGQPDLDSSRQLPVDTGDPCSSFPGPPPSFPGLPPSFWLTRSPPLHFGVAFPKSHRTVPGQDGLCVGHVPADHLPVHLRQEVACPRCVEGDAEGFSTPDPVAARFPG